MFQERNREARAVPEAIVRIIRHGYEKSCIVCVFQGQFIAGFRQRRMALARFIWRNAWRNKRRTGLTVLSVGFSLFLLEALLTFIETLLSPPFSDEAALRLVVARSTSIAEMMPLAYESKIRKVPHVAHVSTLQWFNGTYKDPDFMFANFAVNPDEIFAIYSEQKVDPQTLKTFRTERTAAVASERLAQRFGWKTGDQITLQGTIFPVDLELRIAGTFQDPVNQEVLYFRHDYMDEAVGSFGQVGAFSVRASDVGSVPGIAVSIDAMFRNSPAETKTETEKAFVLGFISMLGNIQTIIGSVAAVVVFTMGLVSLSTMAMTMRERLREVAILKTIGYPQGLILGLVVTEALFIAGCGLGIGLGLGESLRFVDMNKITQGFIPVYAPRLSTYAAMCGVGMLIGLASGFFPARQAVRMTITSAMKRLD